MTTTTPSPRHFFASSVGHFFASSVAEWLADDDIERLIRSMKRSGLPFALWYVPAHVGDEYEIERYAPKIEGAVFLTTIHPKEA